MAAADTVVMPPENLDVLITSLERSMTPEKFRSLVKQVSGRDISSKQAGQFLELFKDEYSAMLTTSTRKFIEQHFGNKNT
jgi:hypothetical protein